MLLDIAKQLDSLRTLSHQPKGSAPELGDKHGAKDKTPKKGKLGNTEDTPKKKKSHEEKSQSRQSPTEKSPAMSSCEHNVALEANKLGTAVAQASLSVARITKVVEDTHIFFHWGGGHSAQCISQWNFQPFPVLYLEWLVWKASNNQSLDPWGNFHHLLVIY